MLISVASEVLGHCLTHYQTTNVFGCIRESACLSVCHCIRQCVCVSVCLCVYKILVILYAELLQFCFNCIETLHIHQSYIEVLQDAILKCQVLLVEELSPLALFFFKLPVSVKALVGVLSHIQ